MLSCVTAREPSLHQLTWAQSACSLLSASTRSDRRSRPHLQFHAGQRNLNHSALKPWITPLKCALNSLHCSTAVEPDKGNSEDSTDFTKPQQQQQQQQQQKQEQQKKQKKQHTSGAAREPKVVWLQTSSRASFTAAIEAGVQHFVFCDDRGGGDVKQEWSKVASIPYPVTRCEIASDNAAENIPKHFSTTFWDGNGHVKAIVARLLKVNDRASLDIAASYAQLDDAAIIIMHATDWKSIPAENLVAAFQDSHSKLYATASTADEARVALQALQGGVSGILLETDDPIEVKDLMTWLHSDQEQGTETLQYDTATVTKLLQVGMGHRVAVDLCESMIPGEGLLVGSFARGLFLVHSECEDSDYITSRPFRVNAGAVHAYTTAEEGKTAYLSELSSGAKVQIADPVGRTRTAVVGRCKVETRPLVLVEATLQDGSVISTLLQNAETVQLVGPSKTKSQGWEATAVSQLQAGSSQVFVSRGKAARHTGIAINEMIVER